MDLLTGQYQQRLSILLGAWVYGGSVSSPDYVIKPMQGKGPKFDPSNPQLQNFTDPQTGVTYSVIPDCYPAATYEDNCFDGIDNDCNGRVHSSGLRVRQN
jgi:hypothetical protein